MKTILSLLILLHVHVMSHAGTDQTDSSEIINSELFESTDSVNVFLLRGLTRESGHWGQPFIDQLKQSIPNARIFLLDLPGSGQYVNDDASFSISKMVDFMRKDVIQIDSGDYYKDVATWSQTNLTIIGLGKVRLIANGANAQGKGIWVISNGNFVVYNVQFLNASVADQNDAGIRFENGNLTVINFTFLGNENGILTWKQRPISANLGPRPSPWGASCVPPKLSAARRLLGHWRAVAPPPH